jgi:hypothetical protein
MDAGNKKLTHAVQENLDELRKMISNAGFIIDRSQALIQRLLVKDESRSSSLRQGPTPEGPQRSAAREGLTAKPGR